MKNGTLIWFKRQQRGALRGTPFLLCNSFLGFKAEFNQALISSDESAMEIDDSSIISVS
jgi:hypothetical protein